VVVGVAAGMADEEALERHAHRIDEALAGLPRWSTGERADGEFASAG
jgi:multidrug resistance protein MdtO